MKTIKVLGVDSNLGYCQGSSHRAVHALIQPKCIAALAQAGLALDWQQITSPPKPTGSLPAINNSAGCERKPLEIQLAHINCCLASKVQGLIAAGEKFLVLGGDHSIAMGTWSGALAACHGRAQSFGLLWIDAHLDAHNFRSSPSANIHGMPLRALLENNDPRLQRLCPQSGRLRGKQLQLLGIRSFEAREKRFLEEKQATITYMHELPRGDCGPALLRALSALSQRCSHIGISLDIDAIEPRHAPGVATPEAEGIQLPSLCRALKQARLFNKVVGLEICEYNPAEDNQQRTRYALVQLIQAFFSPKLTTAASVKLD
ncbi:MAG: arginase family protein [Candidatus Reddybacter sp.]